MLSCFCVVDQAVCFDLGFGLDPKLVTKRRSAVGEPICRLHQAAYGKGGEYHDAKQG